jgi:N-acyl-D-amino-acid deacylase
MKMISAALSASLVLIFGCASPKSTQTQTYDVIIRNGRVVDGSGNPAFFADVGVRDGRIAAIGELNGKAKQEIDAKGLIVAPGFIDVHTHADELGASRRRGTNTPPTSATAAERTSSNEPSVETWQQQAQNFLRMGVTTVVVGNCGGSALDIGRFFDNIKRNKIAINACTLVGHNTVREKAMGGSFDRPPTSEELEKMKSLVAQAMKNGAVGLSTGLIYLPGVFAKSDEIVALAKVAASYDGIYASHMRHEDSKIYEALDEVFRIAREAHIRAEVSHIKLAGERSWHQSEKVLAYIEKARAEGLDITQDQYAYTASSTTMRQLIPDEAFDGGKSNFLAIINDPAKKAKLVADMKKKLDYRGRKDYAYAVIASYRHDKTLNGLNIVEAAKKVRGSDSLEDQIELILDMEKHGSPSGVFHGMNEEDLATFMRHPNTMIACDSGLRKFGEGVPHPRGYGNNARVLGRYVREMKVLRLEDAIRKMTSLPANTFQLKSRGELREGNWADIVVFDPNKVDDPATFTDPHHYAVGIPYVLVNGAVVIKKEEYTGAKPGMGLRHSKP